MDGNKYPKEFKVNNFDLLRLFAATQVIVGHYFVHLNIQISDFSNEILFLFRGVAIFFVISGYLISASFERNNNLKVYFTNRALRIFPGLWVLILVTVIVFSLTGINFFNSEALKWLPCQLAGIIFTPKFLSNYGFGSYNGSLWTIPLELEFYIVLPLCYLLAPKNKINLWFYSLLFIFILIKFSYDYSIGDKIDTLIPKLISYSFLPNFYLFLTGVILQRLKIFKLKIIYNKGVFWLAGYILFSLGGYFLFGSKLSHSFSAITFFIVRDLLLAVCVLSIAYTLPTTASRLLKTNDISYGVYIYHGLVITVLVQEKLTSYENIFLIIGITYILAYLSWIGVEKPSLRRKAKTIRVLSNENL
jgi:peptidoglycan/LPS O-acetylase OafA/YrhL